MPNILENTELRLSVQPYNPKIDNSQNIPLAKDNFVPLAKGKILPDFGNIYVPVSSNPDKFYGKFDTKIISPAHLVYLLLYLPKIDKNILCCVIMDSMEDLQHHAYEFEQLSIGRRNPKRYSLFFIKALLEFEYETGKWIQTSINFNHYYNSYGYKDLETFFGFGRQREGQDKKYIKISKKGVDILEDMSIYHCDMLYDYYFNITNNIIYFNGTNDNTFKIMSLSTILEPSHNIYDNKNDILNYFGNPNNKIKRNHYPGDLETYVLPMPQSFSNTLYSCNMLLTTVHALQDKASLSLVAHKAMNSSGERLPYLYGDAQNKIMNFMHKPPRQQDSEEEEGVGKMSLGEDESSSKRQKRGGKNRKYTKRRQTNKRKTYKR